MKDARSMSNRWGVALGLALLGSVGLVWLASDSPHGENDRRQTLAPPSPRLPERSAEAVGKEGASRSAPATVPLSSPSGIPLAETASRVVEDDGAPASALLAPEPGNPRTGRIEGVVVDCEGQPVPAEIFLRDAPSRSGLPGGGWPRTGNATRKDGRFLLDARAGQVEIYATSAFGAASYVQAFAIAPGSEIRDVRLALLPGGSIEVHLAGFGDRGDQPVLAQDLRFGRWYQGRTDASGVCLLQKLPGGWYSVGLEFLPPGQEAMAQVHDGQTAVVALHRPSREVHVTGRVLAGDAPLAGASVHFGGCFARTDERGGYAVELMSLVTYRVDVEHDSLGLRFDTDVTVPPIEEFEFDIVLDVGWISGRVRDRDGRPLSGVSLSLSRTDMEASCLPPMTRTDRNGDYGFVVLPGTYAILAEEGDDGVSEYVPARRTGIVVEAGLRVTGIDLALTPGGVVVGIVRGTDEKPVEGMMVFVTATGVFRRGTTDGEGRFRIAGNPFGPVLVRAMAYDRVAAPILGDVGTERALEVELVAAPATRLSIRVLGPDGAPCAATVVVSTEEGEIMRLGPEHQDDFGPVPPGAYTLRASLDGRAVETRIELSGEARRDIVLRMD